MTKRKPNPLMFHRASDGQLICIEASAIESIVPNDGQYMPPCSTLINTKSGIIHAVTELPTIVMLEFGAILE